jgi:phosphoglycolate phosphatase
VVSNKGDFAVQDLVRLYFPDAFDFAVGEREGIRRKPAPDTVNAALEALGVTRDQAVYVGDSEVDVATAAASGLDCISVTWGFRSVQTLQDAGATTLVDTTDELLGKILN